MDNATKLLIFPVSGQETAALGRDIYNILRKDYGMANDVEIMDTKRRTKIRSGTRKDHKHPVVTGQVKLYKDVFEFRTMNKHTTFLEELANWVSQHHKQWETAIYQ